MNASHQALIRRGNTLRIEDIQTQPPGRGGLLVALSYVGVCGTDLQILNGTRPDTAGILGHEGVGVVAAAGEGAAMRPGDRVVFNPVADLQEGRILGHNVPGLFQQYITVDARSVERGLVIPAEDCRPPICGALVEPLGAAIYSHDLLSHIVPRPPTAVVFGAGPLGLLTAQWLRSTGSRVLLVHRTQPRLTTAVRLGWVNEGDIFRASDDLPQQILARIRGNRVDAALICTTRAGAPAAFQHALAVVRDGGCIDMITNYPQGAAVPIDALDAEALAAVRAANVCGHPREGAYLHIEVEGRRLALTGHRGTSNGHLRRAMRELRLQPAYASLITHVLSLADAAAGVQKLSQSGERSLHGRDCIKAVIDLTSPRPEHRESTP